MYFKTQKLLTISTTIAAAVLINTAAQAESKGHSYYLVFTQDGQTARGDIVADKNALIVGHANSAVSSDESGISLVQGTVTVVSNRTPVWFALQDNNHGLTLAEHSTVSVAKEHESYRITVAEGEATMRTEQNGAVISSGSTIKLRSNDWQAEKLGEANAIHAMSPRKGSVPVRLLAMDGSKFTAHENALLLKDGAVFAQMPGGIEVRTPTGTLKCTKPYSVSFRTVGDTICLENCASQTLTLDVRGESIKMFPYNSCVVKHVGPEQLKFPTDGVLRRNAVAKSDGSLTAILAEYDPETLIEVHPPLKAALAHPITINEKRAFEELFKGIAILDQLADRGTFTESPTLNREMLGYFKSPIPYDPDHAKKSVAGKLSTVFAEM